jgi:hypothetical protein
MPSTNVFDQMRVDGKGNEISLCIKCGREFWIYWLAGKKYTNEKSGATQVIPNTRPMTLCAPDYFKHHKI